MSDAKFISGLIAKAPHEKAPEYVKAKLSIKREELITWLQSEPGEWINADIKVSQNGKWYAAVDDWKPESRQGNTSSTGSRGGAPQRQRPATATQAPMDDFDSDSIPFISNRGSW